MKEPDKKYPLSIVADLLASTPPNEVVFMPDKIYFDGVDTSTTPRLAINEEYIRKDALIEWLEECKNNPVITDLQKGNIQELIDKLNSI